MQRDLQGYPTLQRKLLEEITRVEEDYKKCGEVPPPPPDWVDAVSAVAKIKTGGGEVVQKILVDIRQSLEGIHDKALAEYRRACQNRHSILEGFMPYWRSLDKTMKQVDKNMTGIQEAAAAVDAQMATYKEIAARSDEAESQLTNSAFTQFAIAAIVMAVALGGAFVNFKLIALPMSEMVGASDYITDNLRTSDVAALVIILMEASMGLFLLESLRITQLFPKIASMDDRMRRRLMLASLIFLVILAAIESSLALMRDMLVADKAALMRDLASAAPPTTQGWMSKIPMAGQMVMGFVLPFALAFVAIPLESVVHSLRTVLGVLLVQTMRGLGFALRFTGVVFRRFARVLELSYDILIVIPLLLERWVIALRGDTLVKAQAKSGSAS